MINTMNIDGVDIAFDDQGYAPDAPAIVLLNGWAHDLRAWNPLLPHLRERHRVIRVCWRGHGPDRTPVGEFGVAEQVSDTIGLLDALEVESFVPLSHAHGGWVGLEVADRLGVDRVPAVLLLDLIMTPPPPEFAAGVAALQDPATWKAARDGLLRSWLDGSTHPAVLNHVRFEAGGHGYDMWARSGREVEKAYHTWGSPMRRMELMSGTRPIRHVFSHPKTDAYDALHAEFAARHPWFSYRRLPGETHFPGLELPEHVAAELFEFLGSTVRG
ncbi:alpha/beta fold hydrolase [Nocardia rhizosphaerihabitans]|uniref:Dioxygenase (1H-3-hydroxy-4-oxoquinaldine 2,4-dioxygenase) n=1 Tax=Nocardia rhizosphaerihabitans TaxID=1691570 RepID=A0ABQ2KCB5_9NOCA|nr:putative dioxygenase (1H-3-hydroxy-4-oxoquinaldine 2,4-dioxygenase) [Nocardia rhizosphaerihabitans]